LFTDERPSWYAIRTRAQHEKLVHDQLVGRGFAAFLPLVERRRRWADRWKTVSVPLFPGCCFARFHPVDQPLVLATTGVVGILGDEDRATAVPDDEVASLMTLVSGPLTFGPHPYLDEGIEGEVLRGPLLGLRGILVRKDRRVRLVVGIHLVRLSAAVELDARDVAPVRAASRASHLGLAVVSLHDATPARIAQHSTGSCRVTAVP
jgi:transcription termination/antitermination protein NusG